METERIKWIVTGIIFTTLVFFIGITVGVLL